MKCEPFPTNSGDLGQPCRTASAPCRKIRKERDSNRGIGCHPTEYPSPPRSDVSIFHPRGATARRRRRHPPRARLHGGRCVRTRKRRGLEEKLVGGDSSSQCSIRPVVLTRRRQWGAR